MADCQAAGSAMAAALLLKAPTTSAEFYRSVGLNGHDTSLVRLTDATVKDKGPILLLHGAYTNGISWFDKSAQLVTDKSLPDILLMEGYDVFIGNRRGTQGSRSNITAPGVPDTTKDPDADGLNGLGYWAYSSEDVALEDYTQVISDILGIRQTEGSDCQKVNVLTHSQSAAEMAILTSTYPGLANDLIARVVNLAPCMLPDLDNVLEVIGLEAPVEGVRLLREDRPAGERALKGANKERRLGSGSSNKSPKKLSPKKMGWNKGEYNAAMRDVRTTLDDKDMYRQFYYDMKDWKKQFGKTWKYDLNW